MKSRTPILYFAIVFALVCVYQLSFTWKVNSIQDEARDGAVVEMEKNKTLEFLSIDTILRSAMELIDSLSSDTLDRNIKIKQVRQNYLDDSLNIVENYLKNKDFILDELEREYITQNYGDDNVFLGIYSYEQCKSRVINLGLDLKGGMNVTLEVAVKDILLSLSGNNKDTLFRAALRNADKNLENSQIAYFDLFSEEFSSDGEELSYIFGTRKLRDEVIGKNNEEVLSFLQSQVESAIESSFDVLRSRIDRFGVTQPNIQKTNVPGRIIVELPGVKDPDRAKKLLQASAQLEFWETYSFSELIENLENANSYLVERSGFQKDTSDGSDTISSIEEYPWFSVCQPIQYQTEDEALSPNVGVVSVTDTSKVNSYIKDDGFMTYFPADLYFAYQKADAAGEALYLVALREKGENGYIMDGSVITDASQSVQLDDLTNQNQIAVSMSMNSQGRNIWRETTGNNIGKSVAIVLDGIVKSAPRINEEIPNGRSSISGDFTTTEATDLANVLNSGKLPARANITQEAIIGPSLGQDSIDSGLKSFIIALMLVLVYMIFYYYGAGLVSNVALLGNIFFIFGVLASLGAVLTLPGIAGIVLTIGMSVDANVLIYERIREEIRSGKGIRLAIEDGYKNAYSSIIDANVTTLLTGIILFSFGTGPIKGFATTLIIGILTSLFCAIFITRLIISARLNKGKSVSFASKITDGAFKNININFIAKRKIFYVLSSILILFGGYSLFTKGLDYGIDFEGGRTYIVSFDGDVDQDDITNELSKVFVTDDGSVQLPSVSSFNLRGQSGTQFKITTKFMIDQNTSEADNLVKEKLMIGLSNIEIPFTQESQEKVGPTIADDIRDSASWSVIFSLLVIFLYILIRFKKWQFSLGALAAVFHDVLIVLSVFSIFYGVLPFSLEINQAFIAAILTIIGYSLNDTVVVFDRVREYIRNNKKKDISELINPALNSTLSRTINTSLTTFLVLLIIFMFGGESIKGFMFALMIGVIVGTYSSLFVASPIMLDTIKNQEQNRK